MVHDDLARRRIVVFTAAVLAAVFGTLLFKHVIMGVLGFSVILFSAFEVLFPARYRLDSNGAWCRVGMSVTELEWSKVRRIAVDDRGVLISPLASASRLDAFRGVYMRFSGNRDEVLVKIRHLWDGELIVVAAGNSVAPR